MRLKRYGLCERKIKGDGNCQFRAVADQLYRDSKFHLDVRRIAVHQLRSNQSSYSQFVPTGASSAPSPELPVKQLCKYVSHVCCWCIAIAAPPRVPANDYV